MKPVKHVKRKTNAKAPLAEETALNKTTSKVLVVGHSVFDSFSFIADSLQSTVLPSDVSSIVFYVMLAEIYKYYSRLLCGGVNKKVIEITLCSMDNFFCFVNNVCS